MTLRQCVSDSQKYFGKVHAIFMINHMVMKLSSHRYSNKEVFILLLSLRLQENVIMRDMILI